MIGKYYDENKIYIPPAKPSSKEQRLTKTKLQRYVKAHPLCETFVCASRMTDKAIEYANMMAINVIPLSDK